MATGVPGSWTGFSEEELARIKREGVSSEQNGEDVNGSVGGVKTASLKRNRNKKRIQHRNSNLVVCKIEDEDEDPNQLLGPASFCRQSKTNQANKLKTSQAVGLNSSPVCLRINEEGQVLEVLDNVEGCRPRDEVVDVKDDSSVESNNVNKSAINNDLEKFEQRQKLMEEQNRHRRALLSKALVERRKKTQAETEKLVHIQHELAKLDNLVSGDVAILRKHIEQASLEFNEAQKRYKRAEEEFVEAKLELFKRMEKKEQLTEHLCTIIEHNESRKAQKLADLMKELEMESLVGDHYEDGDFPFLTQLCALNDNSYNSCSTIKDPNAHKSLPSTPDNESRDICQPHSTTNEHDNANGELPLKEISQSDPQIAITSSQNATNEAEEETSSKNAALND